MVNPATPSGALGIHRDSRVISKIQPKIRIIHIFAPEIIKTDEAHFRELVQQLTGKPSKEKGKGKGKKVKKTPLDALDDGTMISCGKPTVSPKLEVMMGHSVSSSSPSSSSDHHQHHHDQEIWRSSSSDQNNTSGGYLTAFTDLDDNFDFSTVFHMGATDGSSHLNNAFGESTQLSFRG